MKEGETLGINVGNLDPDFTNVFTDEQIFPSKFIFNYKKWTDNITREYLKYVKKQENFGPGGLNPGCFFAHDDF